MTDRNTQSKICLTAFFWGKFNNYFPLWLNSCRYNDTIDFILFTDNETDYDYPANVKRVLIQFADFKEKCQAKFDFKISMQVPYHACDYVPAFGDILDQELKGYDFWGHCDIDLIFGNIRQFIPESILEEHDKISWRGHFSLYKNNYTINNLYKSEIHGCEFYKTIFTNPTQTLFAFEENEINNILENNGYKIYKGLKFADLKTCTNNFELMHFSETFQPSNKNQVFEFREGQLIRHYVINNQTAFDEVMYVHFLKRPMSIDTDFNNNNHFLILPNHFSRMQALSAKNILKWSKKRFYLSYYLERLNWNYYKKRKAGIEDIKEFRSLYNHIIRKEFKTIIDNNE